MKATKDVKRGPGRPSGLGIVDPVDISFRLSGELEEKLRERARARSQDRAEYLRSLIAHDLVPN